ncbi:MAG TPA: pyridoxal 5'-phosphate synthase glutaminase subunit PdxT [Rectinemataceae bacterium]|nr:pyridoxal 5'-phosphate synthase glutaminase subunit PdxT [Rectinemataceae bacterium]
MSSGAPSGLKVGVLALQGDYAAHIAALREAGAEAFEIRGAADLDAADSVVIPGGESTVMGSLLQRFGFMDAFKRRILAGMPVFGTCAGLILLSKDIENRKQPGLGLLDVTVRRNAYGTQIDSFRARITTTIPEAPELEGVFIRAPKITRVGPAVEVLALYDGSPVLVREGSMLGATFHPELVPGALIHTWFLGFPKERRKVS